MTKVEGRLAKFYARLASIPDLRASSPSEFRRLLNEFGRLSKLDVSHFPDGLHSLTPDGIFSAWFHDFHRFARQILTALLEGEHVAVWSRLRAMTGLDATLGPGRSDATIHDTNGRRVVAWPSGELPPPVWHLGHRRLVQRWRVTETEPQQVHVAEFAQLLFVRPFPFARCPVCRAFFVRVRRQQCCSPACAVEAHKPARGAYMRRYMQDRRALLAHVEQRVKDERRTPGKTDATAWMRVLNRVRETAGVHVPKTWSWKNVRDAYLKLE
jgi:hypothetical protein